MQTKLTLRLDEDLINKTKHLAAQRGKSLSKLVSDYFIYLVSKENEKEEMALPPTIKSLYGSLKDTNVDVTDYKNHILKKYL